MANTEGMPDEVLETLLGNPSSSLAELTTTRSTTMSSRQQRLQKRMDMPIGGRPAATVIRPSSKSRSSSISETHNAEEDAFSQSESKSTSSIPPPIVGSIVERPPVFGTTGATTPKMGISNQKISRFAQQQKLSSSSASKALSSSLNINGFPSVNVPLGTFVNKRVVRVTPKQHEETAPSQKLSTPGVSTSSTGNVDYLASIRQEPGPTPRTSTSTDDIQAIDRGIKDEKRGNEISQLLDESERQAHAMLSQMSEIEINESVKELESSIPPELQLFLKQRGAAKRKQQQIQQSNASVSTQQHSYQLQEPVQIRCDEVAEKKRLADLVSSIKTHEELDVVYQAEQKQDVNFDHESLQSDKKLDAGVGTQVGDDSDDFSLACSLLRSTVPRQRLWGARTVSSRLQRDFERRIESFGNGKWKGSSTKFWPIVLPVSLRCLLDQPPHHSNSGYLVHTYVLQSIYYLLALTVHPDHVVSLHDWSRSLPMVNTCFQSFYMDDAVPTPLLRDCYQSTQPLKPLAVGSDEEARKAGAHARDNNPNEAVAYATSSSSSSAQVDGDAFDRDPMWTLLSRMRILPRMAQLLDLSSSYSQSQQGPKQDDPATFSRLPQEALVAIAGILAILCQRSPGAASAIVHHQTLLQQLLNNTLLRLVRLQNDENDNDDLGEKEHMKSAMISVSLLCTLARQSRVSAAKLLPLVVDDIIPGILSQSITSKGCEMRLLQQWVLILWRTLLRFGLGLSNLSTIISLGAPHLALNQGSENLAPFFLSALTQVLECVRFAKRKSAEEARSRIPEEDLDILSLAGAWLASSKQAALTRLSSHKFQDARASDANLKEEIRSSAVELRFLNSFYSLTMDLQDQAKDEIKIENLLTDDAHVWLEAMVEWMDDGGAIDRAWRLISPYIVCKQRGDVKDVTSSQNPRECRCFDWELEASTCAFLDSTVSALLTLENVGTQHEEIRDRARFAVEKFLAIILDGMRGATLLPLQAEQYGGGSIDDPPCAQQGWINQCLFAVSKLLFHGMSVGILNSSEDVSLVRMLVFSLLGRLQIGNESMAAVLYSQDVLFTAICDPTLEHVDVHFKSSPMSNMFMEELCGSKSTRQQLDHSFQLQHGFGITPDGFGAFMLHSLRSDSDQVPKEGSSSSSDLVLPLGRLWLWQTLSGSIQPAGQSLKAGTREASSVVSACLGLILAVEEEEDLLNPNNDGTCHRIGYAGRIPLGARLYHIMNVCLHPEAILREDNVFSLVEAVLDIYLRRVDRISVDDFATACLQHSNPTKKEQAESDQQEDIELNENEKKAASLFHKELTTTSASDYSNLSSKQMRALMAFLEDLTSAYTDYGAQYSFFTKCMRIFLLPIFPSPLRCHVLRELRGMLHLLTLPHEFDDPSGIDMRTLVEQSVSVGFDGSLQMMVRDPSDILDLASSILGTSTTGGGGNQRPLQGYVLQYALAIIIRNVASTSPWQQGSSDTTAASAREACKKRLLRLDVAVVKILLDSSVQFLSSKGKKSDLVNVVMNCATLYPIALANENHERIDENALRRMLEEANEALSLNSAEKISNKVKAT